MASGPASDTSLNGRSHQSTSQWIGRARLAVLLTMIVALLSVITGVANIGTQQFTGPLAALIPPDVQQAAGFTGALTGFLMVGTALGMRRRLQVAWYFTILLLPVTAAQGFLQATFLSLPLIVLSLAALPSVWLSRRHFDQHLDLTTTQLAAGAALATAQAYGTVGAFALRTEYDGIDTLLDAFYYSLVTSSTVGYGDILPLTQRARLFAISVVVVGTASFAVALGALLVPVIEARFATALGKMNERQLELLDDHVIVLGYGDMTEPMLEELEAATEFVVVTANQDAVTAMSNRGFNVLTGDPSDEETQYRAGIEDAQAVLAATNHDAADALSVLTARQLNPDIRVVAAATDKENVKKLKRAGADTVISPAVIGGHLLVLSAMGTEGVEDLADRLLLGDQRDQNGE